MKKWLHVFIIFFIFVSTLFIPPVAYGATKPNHEEMIKNYEGYGEAFTQTLAESSAHLAGKYTDTRDNIDQHIGNVKKFANQWWKDMGKDMTVGEYFSMNAAALITVGDGILNWLGNLFKDDLSEPALPEGCTKAINVQLYIDSEWLAELDCGYSNSASGSSLKTYVYSYRADIVAGHGSGARTKSNVGVLAPPYSLGTYDYYLRKYFGLHLQKNGVEVFKQDRPEMKVFNQFNDWKGGGGGNPPMHIPQLKPVVSCPDGQKIVVPDGKGGFVDGSGKPVPVDNCTIKWQVPKIEYDEKGDVIADGENIETGENTGGGDGDGGSGEGCEGVVCLAGKIIDAIANIGTAIAGVAKSILDGLVGIFVPKNLDFVTDQFDEMKNKLEDKFSIIGDLTSSMEDFFEQENTNPLADLEISLPAAGNKPIEVVEMTFIDKYVPTLKKVMSGILVIMTIFYVYRKISGRGGVMEK